MIMFIVSDPLVSPDKKGCHNMRRITSSVSLHDWSQMLSYYIHAVTVWITVNTFKLNFEKLLRFNLFNVLHYVEMQERAFLTIVS